MSEVDVIIEIAKGSHIKYEYDKEKNIIVCDRILHTPMKYPFNYGFIPNTLSEDGDPLDVVVLMDDELIPGCMIKCRILGFLDTKDDSGNDPKMIVCPIDKIDPTWNNIDNLFTLDKIIKINNISDEDISSLVNLGDRHEINKQSNINNHTMIRIKYFFQHYKDLENKSVIVGEFYDKLTAIKIYLESKNRFKYNSCQKNKITDYFKITH